MAEEDKIEIVYEKIEKGITSPAMQWIPLTDATMSPQMPAVAETVSAADATPKNDNASSGSTSNGRDQGKG